MKLPALRFLILLVAGVLAHAGMIGDTVSSTLHTAFAGSWSGGAGPESAVVGGGVEFTRDFFGLIDISLDIADTSFVLTFTNNEPSGSFNLGLDGFEFTDPTQHFVGVNFVSSTFPVGTFTALTFTSHTIQVSMNEPIIPAGATWSSTWDVSFAPALVPEPMTLSVVGLALAALAVRLRNVRRSISSL